MVRFAADDRTDLTGQLLIAMPGMPDPRFAESVIYICAYSDDGAMGLVVNKRYDDIDIEDLLEELEIKPEHACADMPVHFGGPVEAGRGFVLHTADFEVDGTLDVAGNIALTSSIEVLSAIADGRGPAKSLLALGYAGWGPGQLELEIQENGWLHVPADEMILFGRENDSKWRQAMAKLGVDLGLLSSTAGRA